MLFNFGSSAHHDDGEPEVMIEHYDLENPQDQARLETKIREIAPQWSQKIYWGPGSADMVASYFQIGNDTGAIYELIRGIMYQISNGLTLAQLEAGGFAALLDEVVASQYCINDKVIDQVSWKKHAKDLPYPLAMGAVGAFITILQLCDQCDTAAKCDPAKRWNHARRGMQKAMSSMMSLGISVYQDIVVPMASQLDAAAAHDVLDIPQVEQLYQALANKLTDLSDPEERGLMISYRQQMVDNGMSAGFRFASAYGLGLLMAQAGDEDAAEELVKLTFVMDSVFKPEVWKGGEDGQTETD